MTKFRGYLKFRSDRGDHVINEARTYVYLLGQITETRCTNYWETALMMVTSLELLGFTQGRPRTEPEAVVETDIETGVGLIN